MKAPQIHLSKDHKMTLIDSSIDEGWVFEDTDRGIFIIEFYSPGIGIRRTIVIHTSVLKEGHEVSISYSAVGMPNIFGDIQPLESDNHNEIGATINTILSRLHDHVEGMLETVQGYKEVRTV